MDPALRSGKKIPKFNRHARLGQFLGFSEDHSLLVAKIRHLSTGFVSPQHHLVFDNKFEPVFSSSQNDKEIDAICAKLFESSSDIYVEPEHDFDNNLVYLPPPLDEIWLTEPEHREHKGGLMTNALKRRYPTGKVCGHTFDTYIISIR